MKEHEIGFDTLWRTFKKCWYIMLIAAILFGAAFGIFTEKFMTKKYESSTSFIITVDTEKELTVRDDITYRVALTPGAIDMLLTRDTANKLAKIVEEKKAYSLEGVSFSIDASIRNKSRIETDLLYSFDVSVRSTSKEATKVLANALKDNINDILSEKGFFEQANIKPLEDPSAASQYAPSVTTNALLGVLLGLALTYVVALLIVMKFGTINREEELAEASGVPFLAQIARRQTPSDHKHEVGVRNPKLISEEGTPFAVEEAYRTLRTNLIYAVTNEETPIYGILSGDPHEGKSLTSANLAIAFAQIGRRTLLVDSDLRLPTQYKLFGFDASVPGVTDYMAGVTEKPNIMDSGVENLSIFLSGHPAPDPTALLHNNRFASFLEQMKAEYDCIVVDLPPVRTVPDALIVAPYTTGVVLVSKAGEASYRGVKETMALLDNVKATKLGCVLNAVNVRTKKRFGNHRYNYYYNYYNYDKKQGRKHKHS